MSLNKDLTIIFVSYFSKKLIEKPLNTISKEIKVLIIENSLDLSAKNELESKYSNVKVIFPKENLGNGGGINEGLKLVDTKYAFYLDIDTLLKKDTLEQLYLHANKIENFSILGPYVINFDYKKEYFEKKDVLHNVHSMNFMTGCALFFNVDVIRRIGSFDENIFLYYEENDLYLRCKKENKPIFLIGDAKINHQGNSSVDRLDFHMRFSSSKFIEGFSLPNKQINFFPENSY